MADVFTPEKRSSIMSRVRGSDTEPELLVRSMLHHLGYRFRLHRKDLPGRPDVVLPGRRSIVFVHGCFWHGHTCPRGNPPTSNTEFWQRKIAGNRERDSRVQKELKQSGWKVLTIWQCETKNKSALAKRLAKFLGRTKLTVKKR